MSVAHPLFEKGRSMAIQITTFAPHRTGGFAVRVGEGGSLNATGFSIRIGQEG